MQTHQTTTSPRRPRSRPTARGKRVAITEHDLTDIFEPLARHSYLTTKQLVAFGRRYPSKTRNRLTDLYHEGDRLLVRLSEEHRLADHLFIDEMYAIGDEALSLLQMRGLVPAEDWVLASRIGGNNSAPSKIMRLAHDHFASHVALDIEIGARTAGVEFRDHLDIIAASPERTQRFTCPLRIPVPAIPDAPRWIEPDALFSVNGVHYALEADTGSESIRTIIKGKILAYREIVASCVIDDHFGIDHLRVLFATTNEKRMRNIMRAVAGVANNGRSAMFGFACVPELADFAGASAPDGSLFARKWERVGYEALQLDGSVD